MGAVYVAEQLSTGEHRAIKVMQPTLVDNAEARKRFEREARVGGQIKSDFVVRVIQAGVDDATKMPWLAMELLEGEDLESYLDKHIRFTPSDFLALFEQLCDALDAAHRVGVVHRDLKPENIFLALPRRRRDRFHVKVLDFGIARMLAEAQTTTSKTRSVLGTPLFMAPEQARPGTPIDARTDIWALGLIAFRMLVGRHFWRSAYDANPTVVMLAMEAYVEPLPAASVRATQWGYLDTLLPGFDAWFARCVSRDPCGRFSSAGEAFSALETLYASGASESRPRGATPSASTTASLEPLSRVSSHESNFETQAESMAQVRLPISTELMPAVPTAHINSTIHEAAQSVPQPRSGVPHPTSRRTKIAMAGFVVAACSIAALWFVVRAHKSSATPEAPVAELPSDVPLSVGLTTTSVEAAIGSTDVPLSNPQAAADSTADAPISSHGSTAPHDSPPAPSQPAGSPHTGVPVPPKASGSSSTIAPTLNELPCVSPQGIDECAIRRGLEPRVWAGKGSLDEIRMLKAICSHRGDRACRDRAAAMLAAKLQEAK